MLELYARIAKPVHRYRFVLWPLLAGAGGLFVYDLFRFENTEGRVPGSLIVFLWAAFLLAMGQCFSDMPPAADPRAKLIERLVSRLKRGLLWMLALVTTALFGLVALLSVRAAGMYVHGLWQ